MAMFARSTKATLAVFILSFPLITTAHPPTAKHRQLPEYIHQCYRDDPKLAECVKIAVYGIVRKLETGIPELGVPPIEPLLKDEIDAFDVAGFHLKVTDIVIRGMSTLHISWNSASLKNRSGEYAFRGGIEETTIEARYQLRGSFFFLPILSEGTIFARVNADYLAGGTSGILTRNGTDYVKIEELYIKIHINEGSLWISNLGIFEAAINRLLNGFANIRFIWNHITPVIDESFKYIVLKFASRITSTVPFDAVLPEGTGPVETEPVGTEPVGTEPVGTEPVGIEPVGTEPVETEPVGTGQLGTEPVGTELVDAGTVKTATFIYRA